MKRPSNVEEWDGGHDYRMREEMTAEEYAEKKRKVEKAKKELFRDFGVVFSI